MLLFDAAGFGCRSRSRRLVARAGAAARRSRRSPSRPTGCSAPRAWPAPRPARYPAGGSSRSSLPDVGTALRQLTSAAPTTGLDRSATAPARGRVRRGVARRRPQRPGRATARPSTTCCSPPRPSRSAGRCAAAATPRASSRRWCRSPSAAPATAGDLGNAISFVTVELPVAEIDPVAVLRRVAQPHAGAQGGRRRRGRCRPSRSSATCCPAPRAAPSRERRRGRRRSTASSPTSPGRRSTSSCSGRRVTAIFPAVPFLHGHSLSIGALSYRGRLHLGLYADADVVPDVVDVARDLEAAFDALRLPPGPARHAVARPRPAPSRRYPARVTATVRSSSRAIAQPATGANRGTAGRRRRSAPAGRARRAASRARREGTTPRARRGRARRPSRPARPPRCGRRR